MVRKNKFTEKVKKHTPADEENLQFEILEDSRLRSIGIDPDGDSVDIMRALDEKAAAYTNPRKKPEDDKKD